MHVVLRPAGEQMFDTRAWLGPAVVGGERKCTSQAVAGVADGTLEVFLPVGTSFQT